MEVCKPGAMMLCFRGFLCSRFDGQNILLFVLSTAGRPDLAKNSIKGFKRPFSAGSEQNSNLAVTRDTCPKNLQNLSP